MTADPDNRGEEELMDEPLDLAPIEKRAGRGTYASVTNIQRQDDTRALLAEVKRLRALIEAIQTAHLAAWCQDCQSGAPCPTVDATI